MDKIILDNNCSC